MKIVNIPAVIPLAPDHIIQPGRYMAPEMVAMQLLLMLGDGSMEELDVPVEKYQMLEGADMNGKRIMLQRVGGFGDLVLLTPVMREMKRRWPTCHIGVSCMAHYGVVFAGLPYVDELLPFPLSMEAANTYDAWVLYENAIEKNPAAHETHMTDLFGEIAGLRNIENCKPEYRIKPTEAIWASEAYPRNFANRVAIQVGASGRCRRYPKMGDLLNELIKGGFEVMLLGTENEIPALRGKRLTPQIRNLTEAGLSFRQSCAVANTADVFIGADSAILHVAGALDIPSVGLYGPFPWKLRTIYNDSILPLQGTGACAPCFHHNMGSMEKHFPDHCPSKEKGFCQVLATLTPERIVEKAKKIMRKIEPANENIVAMEPK